MPTDIERRDSVPRAAYERNLAKRQRQIDESHAALRRRNRWIAELEHLLCKEMSYSLRRDAGCLAPKVLDADGVEIRVGDEVWHVETGEQCKVVEVDSRSVSVDFRVDGDGTKHTGSILPANLTHRAPVLAADGRPLRDGEMVYSTENGDEFTVIGIDAKSGDVHIRWGYDFEDKTGIIAAELLTHERPVVDTWERLEEDAEKDPCDYFGFDGEEICGKCPASGKNCEQTMARDLVRRAKALAERDA